MAKKHYYKAAVKWTGNHRKGTVSYHSYERNFKVMIAGKQAILGSSDTAFRGDKTKHNPEELLLAALSSCHMLWYLHLCSEHGIVVTDYTDNATGTMVETATGSGHFTEVILSPVVKVVKQTMIDKANELHKKANELCFIAQSVNFPVYHNPTTFVGT